MHVALRESSRSLTAAAQARVSDSTVTTFDSTLVSVPHQGTIQHVIDLSPTAEVTQACAVGSETATASTELKGHVTIEKTLTRLRYVLEVEGLGQGETTRSPDANGCEGPALVSVYGALSNHLDIFPNRPATYAIEIEYATDAWEDNSNVWAGGLSGGFAVGDLLDGDQLSGWGQVASREPLSFGASQSWRSTRGRRAKPQGARLKIVFTVTLLE